MEIKIKDPGVPKPPRFGMLLPGTLFTYDGAATDRVFRKLDQEYVPVRSNNLREKVNAMLMNDGDLVWIEAEQQTHVVDGTFNCEYI